MGFSLLEGCFDTATTGHKSQNTHFKAIYLERKYTNLYIIFYFYYRCTRCSNFSNIKAILKYILAPALAGLV